MTAKQGVVPKDEHIVELSYAQITAWLDEALNSSSDHPCYDLTVKLHEEKLGKKSIVEVDPRNIPHARGIYRGLQAYLSYRYCIATFTNQSYDVAIDLHCIGEEDIEDESTVCLLLAFAGSTASMTHDGKQFADMLPDEQTETLYFLRAAARVILNALAP